LTKQAALLKLTEFSKVERPNKDFLEKKAQQNTKIDFTELIN